MTAASMVSLARGELRMGDDVRDVVEVLVGFAAVGLRHVVDQTFIERPGVYLALPVVDDRIAEAVRLGLLIGRARRQPGFLGRLMCRVCRLGEEGIDGLLQVLGGEPRILIGGFGDVCVVDQHRRAGRVGGKGGRGCGRAQRERCADADQYAWTSHGLSPLKAASAAISSRRDP